MIEIVQAGQAGKTGLLLDMHRLRKRVFSDLLKWDVTVNDDGLEVDAFDLPHTVYLLALNKDKRVIGNWRLLPASGPTMIRDVWPQFLKTLPMPESDDVFEVSRFAIHSPEDDAQEAEKQQRYALGEMFCALTEICIMAGVHEIHTMYDDRIAKVIERIDCRPYKTSEKIEINGMTCQTGAFKTNSAMLTRLRNATGITENLINNIDMPPMILARLHPHHQKEETHA